MIKNRMFLEKAKTKLKSTILIGSVFAASGMLFACSEDETNKGDGVGQLVVTLDADAAVNAITKADTEDDTNAPNLNDFTISIVGSIESKTLDFADLETPIDLKEGSYIITAISGDPAKEGFVGKEDFERPWYQANQAITIKGGETLPVNLSATLQNAKVSVKYTSEFVDYFQDYEVSISLKSSKGTGYFILDKDQTYEPLYLIPGELSLNVDIAGNQGAIPHYEEKFSISLQTHYILTFDVETGPKGDATLNITFVGPETNDLGEINLGE